MRTLVKLNEPTILTQNSKTWLKDYLADLKNDTKKYKYRHTEIKDSLKSETGNKCVYCESKIGHNTPGDIEHIVPSSKNRKLHFTWSNLTIACTECNRRKNDYYQKGKHFLHPYEDKNIESQLIHMGPLVYSKNGNKRAEITMRILEFSNKKRIQLIIRKMEIIDAINNELERYYTETNLDLKELLRLSIIEKSKVTNEFSGMINTILIERGLLEPIAEPKFKVTFWEWVLMKLNFKRTY